ncbi:MAG: flagellar motor switch protein FliM [bacterium]
MAESDILSQDEIDRLLSTLTAGPDSASSQASADLSVAFDVVPSIEDISVDEDKKGYKLYNFRRPDKFSKDHLRALQDIHKEFCRQLSLVLGAYLRLHIEIDVISVDQLTYDEFARSMPSPVTIGVIELNPLPGQVLVGLSHEITSCIVDRMLGGIGSSEAKSRELTDIEEALVKRVFLKLIKTLEESWRNIYPVQSSIIGMDSTYALIQIAGPGEIVALITLEIQIGGKYSGLLSICFPYPVLETVLSQLSSQHIFQTKGIIQAPEDKENILFKLNNTKVNMNVVLGNTEISVNELLDLKDGDVLMLDSFVSDNLIVNVNNLPKFLARPGTKKNKVAISIVDELESMDNLLK